MTGDRSSATQRAEVRRWVREHHPDVGGDPEEFAAGLARLRAGPAGAARPDRYDAPIEFVTSHQRLRAELHRWYRRLRGADPPRVR